MKQTINLTSGIVGAILGVLLITSINTNYAASISSNKFQNRNTIIGLIFDPSGSPVSQIYVELQNEVNSTIARARTDDGGRFIFTGLSAGTFKVNILVHGTSYLEHSEDVSLGNFSNLNGSGSRAPDNQYLEIKLRYDKKRFNNGIEGVATSVFAQDVPNSAKKLYERGIAELDENKESGLAYLKKSIEIFPTYFMSLNRLGIEYAKRNENQLALPYLVKAIDINQRSFSSYYALGLICYRLKYFKESLNALQAAIVLEPQSVKAHLWYGAVSRESGNLVQAEKSLLKAKELSKNLPLAEVHYQLALLYNHTNRNKEAADELELYLKIQPDAPNKEQIKNLIAQLRTKAK